MSYNDTSVRSAGTRGAGSAVEQRADLWAG